MHLFFAYFLGYCVDFQLYLNSCSIDSYHIHLGDEKYPVLLTLDSNALNKLAPVI